ncbi:DEAD/DEAH box helicase [Ottowia caeni]|uniref:DEAD/DEAH box helicase n=1 Tax=Ottowia caeni TaxID=2870339 RepID=UPI001E411909|nr:DEAD/DEAH box helicase [Ottowia caeni]
MDSFDHLTALPSQETAAFEAPAFEAALPEAVAPANATPNAFAALGLAPELVQAVADLGFTEPTTVQARAIPLALQGDAKHFADLMVSSQTGSGKTAAFLLPVLHTLIAHQEEAFEREKAAWDAKVAEALSRGEPAPKRPRRKDPTNSRHFKPAVPGALVLCPTRELAQQVAADAIDLVKHCRGLRIANIVGGMPYQLQIAKLQNANLVVATPGRLLDLQRSGQIKLDEVRFLVVDEADRMLDLGFADDLAEVNQLTVQREQTMMFSATFAPRIQQLAMRVMHDGGSRVQRIQIDSPREAHANIRQELYWADSPDHKRRLLDYWLRDPAINQAIVFACTQIECEELAEDLQQAGFAAVSLHGALSQAVRNRRLTALREGRVQILVATDVAARGIDVPTITHVFNFGLPMKADDYTHRIGRTGRAGRDGLAVTLAEIRDRRRLADIEACTQQPFKPLTIDGLEPTKSFPPVTGPKEFGRGGKPGGRPRRSSGGREGFGRPHGGDSRGPRQFNSESSFDRSDRGAGAGGRRNEGFGDFARPSHGQPMARVKATTFGQNRKPAAPRGHAGAPARVAKPYKK